jgi:hypothetical protein
MNISLFSVVCDLFIGEDKKSYYNVITIHNYLEYTINKAIKTIVLHNHFGASIRCLHGQPLQAGLRLSPV